MTRCQSGCRVSKSVFQSVSQSVSECVLSSVTHCPKQRNHTLMKYIIVCVINAVMCVGVVNECRCMVSRHYGYASSSQVQHS